MRQPEHEDEYAALDRMDENLIVEKMRGGLVEERYAYSFSSRGDTVVGLSAEGIQRIAQSYGNIDVEMVEFKENEDEYIFIAKATDKATGLSMMGAAQQRKEEKGKYDRFAVAKVTTKAQRNALRGILPVPLLEKLVKVFLDEKKDKERASKIASINTRVDEFGYDKDKFDKYCRDNYESAYLEDLDNNQLSKIQRYILSSRAKRELK